MVRIIDFKKRENSEGKEFFVLVVSGGIEMIKSQTTGNYYLTGKKTNVPTTFDEATCKGLIGSELPGKIVKQECEPYEYTIKETGEIILLEHRYVFVSEVEITTTANSENMVKANPEVFSKNGIAEPVF